MKAGNLWLLVPKDACAMNRRISAWSYRAVITLESQRCCELAHTTRELTWMDTAPLERIGQYDGQSREHFTWQSREDTGHSALGLVMSQMRVLPFCSICHEPRKVRTFSDSWRKPFALRPWFLREALTTPMSSERSAQQDTGSPGGLWIVLMGTSWHRWLRSWSVDMLC